MSTAERSRTVALCAHEVARRIDLGQAVLVDVRDEDDYAGGHIPGAVPDPLDGLDPDDYGAARLGDVIFCCQDGTVSAEAARRLLQHGAGSVQILDGGMTAWRACGFPLLASTRPPDRNLHRTI